MQLPGRSLAQRRAQKRLQAHYSKGQRSQRRRNSQKGCTKSDGERRSTSILMICHEMIVERIADILLRAHEKCFVILDCVVFVNWIEAPATIKLFCPNDLSTRFSSYESFTNGYINHIVNGNRANGTLYFVSFRPFATSIKFDLQHGIISATNLEDWCIDKGFPQMAQFNSWHAAQADLKIKRNLSL